METQRHGSKQRTKDRALAAILIAELQSYTWRARTLSFEACQPLSEDCWQAQF
jgi:hypothetical protein